MTVTLAFGGRRRREFTELVVLSGASPGDRVLDPSCGPGYLTRLAADAVRPAGTARGIDPSPTVIDYARQTAKRENCSSELGIAEHLAAPDNTFDVALSSLMIHNLPDDVRPGSRGDVPGAAPRRTAPHRRLSPTGKPSGWSPHRRRDRSSDAAQPDPPPRAKGRCRRLRGARTRRLHPYLHYVYARRQKPGA